MELRVKSTGYRQRAWDALHVQDWPSVEALALHIGAAASGLRNYIRALCAAGYIERDNAGALHLARRTGPRAPSYNLQRDEMHDWNLSPRMDGDELGALIGRSGLSLRKWLAAHDMDPAGQTRLRQMINGQRPVSGAIEAAARGGGSPN